MKVLVTGANGQLGHDVVNELRRRGHEAVATDVDQLDITDENAVDSYIGAAMPEAVIHCAAYTAVDAAEENAKTAEDVNAKGTENIAKSCKKNDCKLIYISTDYVFSGRGTKPWEPYDERGPLSVYGRTKMDGELAVEKHLERYFIVRIAWVFGANGGNFVKTMLKLAAKQKEISVVNDQIGTPTYTYDLSRLLIDMAESSKYGVYHATNEGGYISWFEFAKEIFKTAALIDPKYADVKVVPVSSGEFKAKAARPLNSRMDKSAIAENGFAPLADWKDALGRYLKEIEV